MSRIKQNFIPILSVYDEGGPCQHHDHIHMQILVKTSSKLFSKPHSFLIIVIKIPSFFHHSVIICKSTPSIQGWNKGNCNQSCLITEYNLRIASGLGYQLLTYTLVYPVSTNSSCRVYIRCAKEVYSVLE